MKRSLITLAIAAALAAPAFAAEGDRNLTALEARIRSLEAEMQAQRQQAEEARASLAEARAEIEVLKTHAVAPAAVVDANVATEDVVAPDVVAPAEDPSAAIGGGGNANAFNPAISLVLNGTYAHHSLDTEAYTRAGFPLVGEGGPGEQGFSLGESEIALSANIDDKFYGQLTVAVASEDGEDGVEIEEAFVDTTSLPNGLQLRLGRFFSNIGYLNNHHAHTDKFSDRPLPYQAFLGNKYGDDGVQLRWVAPTNTFVELGGELLRGQNFPSGGAARSGVGTRTVFAHFGGDVGVESSWLAGVSMLDTRTEGGEDGFSGDLRLWLADATWKWAPGGNHKDGGIQLRAEYFLEQRDGDFIDAEDSALNQPWDGTRRGAYLEGVWRINRLWETGYRYDRLWADGSGPYASTFDPYRHTWMLTWRNSEFSLLRLQFSSDKPNAEDTDNVVSLRYTHALGAHGAHKF